MYYNFRKPFFIVPIRLKIKFRYCLFILQTIDLKPLSSEVIKGRLLNSKKKWKFVFFFLFFVILNFLEVFFYIPPPHTAAVLFCNNFRPDPHPPPSRNVGVIDISFQGSIFNWIHPTWIFLSIYLNNHQRNFDYNFQLKNRKPKLQDCTYHKFLWLFITYPGRKFSLVCQKVWGFSFEIIFY